MQGRSLPALAGAAFALTVILVVQALAQAPAEPEEYRLENFRAPTPATLRGAVVVSTSEAEPLWRQGAAFIDVMPQPPRPAQLAAGTFWRSPPRDSIPGALWLANVGFGEIAAPTEAYFRWGLVTASRGNLAAPLVFFCLRDCWMSWNAAKRATSYGYRAVHWYPDGTDGWRDAGLPLAPLEPIAEPGRE